MGFLFFLFKIILFVPYEQAREGAAVEGNEGIEVMALARDGGVRGNESAKQKDSCAEAPNAKAEGEGEYHHSHKFEGVAELVVLLGEVCYRNESHIENNVLG